MSFPLSPANNQVTLENGIAYTYNASRGAWYRTPATALASLTSNNFTVLNSIIFSDGTSQTSAASPTDAFARTTANTATNNITILQGVNAEQNTRITIAEGVDVGQNTRMTIIEGVDATQNTNITIATNAATAAFARANTSITTSGGTITGNLSVNAFTANTITANGVDLGTAVASAFLLANNASKTTTSNTAPLNPNVGDMWFDTITSITFRYTNDGVSNNWIDITGPQNAGFIYQSYSLTPNTTSINETTGNTVIYTIASTNTADNTVLYWTNSGTTVAADFRDGISNGSVTIINNSATITRSLVGDLTTEGSETIILNLRTGSNTGTVVAVSPTVTIGDTSITPFTVNYLLVAGGGGSGAFQSAGGGAGGYLTGNTTSLLPSTPYLITIGTGGAGATPAGAGAAGAQGTNTTLGSLFTSIGGGGGGGYLAVGAAGATTVGGAGGSGGGGGGAGTTGGTGGAGCVLIYY